MLCGPPSAMHSPLRTDRMQPPTDGSDSSNSTDKPIRFAQNAHDSPEIPPPTTATSTG